MNDHKAFEWYMRAQHGWRYDLSRDSDGFYCREVVKRMFEVFRYCRRFEP